VSELADEQDLGPFASGEFLLLLAFAPVETTKEIIFIPSLNLNTPTIVVVGCKKPRSGTGAARTRRYPDRKVGEVHYLAFFCKPFCKPTI
jgi:hypothetical protein